MHSGNAGVGWGEVATTDLKSPEVSLWLFSTFSYLTWDFFTWWGHGCCLLMTLIFQIYHWNGKGMRPTLWTNHWNQPTVISWVWQTAMARVMESQKCEGRERRFRSSEEGLSMVMSVHPHQLLLHDLCGLHFISAGLLFSSFCMVLWKENRSKVEQTKCAWREIPRYQFPRKKNMLTPTVQWIQANSYLSPKRAGFWGSET